MTRCIVEVEDEQTEFISYLSFDDDKTHFWKACWGPIFVHILFCSLEFHVSTERILFEVAF